LRFPASFPEAADSIKRRWTWTLSRAKYLLRTTFVSAGILESSSLGTGNVEVAAGATLTLDLNTAIGSSAFAYLGWHEFLCESEFSSARIRSELFFVNGSYVSVGLHSAADLGSQFAGTGSFQVTSAVPEPSVYLLMGLGL